MNVSLNCVKRGLPKFNDATSLSSSFAKIVLCKSVTDGFPRIDAAGAVPVPFNKFCKLIAAFGSNPELFPNAIAWTITRMFVLAFSTASPAALFIPVSAMVFTAIACASHFMFDQSSAFSPTAATAALFVAVINRSNPGAPAAAAAKSPAAPTVDPANAATTARGTTRAASLISAILPAVIAFP